MKKYEYLIFDMDDTLIDNIANIRFAFTKMMEFMGREATEEEFQRWYQLDKQFWLDFHAGLIVVPEEYQVSQELFVQYVQSLRYILFFHQEISVQKAFTINDLFLNALKEVVIEIEGASKVLEKLSLQYKIVIATNGPRQAVYTKVDKIGCRSYVDYVFSADMTKNTVTKPNEKYFEELFAYLQYHEKEKILVIGDSLHSDIQGGINAGIDTCWFCRHPEEISTTYPPTYTITKLEELLSIL